MTDEVSVVIEPPRKTMRRKPGGAFDEVVSFAWVKFSTAFKEELPNISGNALKVWTYIALSVNHDGLAFPAILTIAKGVGLSHQTVIEAIHELEGLGLLSVNRGNGRQNLYKVDDDYIKIGRGEPVQKLDRSGETSPETGLTSLDSMANHSTRVESNKNNKINKNIPKTDFLYESDLSWFLAAGKPVTEKQLAAQKEKAEFEGMIDKQLSRLGLNFMHFTEEDKDKFRKFIAAEERKGRELSVFVDWWLADDFRRTALPWKLDPIRQQWLKAFTEQAVRPEYERYVPEEVKAVPNPRMNK